MRLNELISKEWAVLKLAPITFLSLAAVSGSAGFWLASEVHKGEAAVLNSQVRLHQHEISELRNRLEFRPTLGNEYAKHSNQDLKSETLKLVAELRDLVRRGRDQEHALEVQYRALSAADTTKEQRQQRWSAWTTASAKITSELMAAYERSYKVRALILREELRRRVNQPVSLLPPVEMPAQILYAYPTNPIGLTRITDDLEDLARRL